MGKAFSDTLTFAINLAVTTNMLQFVYTTTVSKRSEITPFWCKWGPFCLIAAASVASLADISRQVLLDSKSAMLTVGIGSLQAFDFDHCTYTATAIPLKKDATVLCPQEPL